jgi:hypothetical protein
VRKYKWSTIKIFLKQFVGENFVIPDSSANAFKTAPRERSMRIDRL